MYGVGDDLRPHTSIRPPAAVPHLASPPEDSMTIRIAAIEVGHWHAVHDAASLRHLTAMPDVALVGVQDSDAALAKKRAREVGSPPTFTDYPLMLAETKPDFVLGLGRHRQMAKIAHDLLDRGLPFRSEEHTSELQSHLNLVC